MTDSKDRALEIHEITFDARDSRTADAPEGAPKWLARCDAHGTTTPADDAKSARARGSRARRAEWCKPCKAAVVKSE